MTEIRQAGPRDISRIAEILIFTKRTTYRPIFDDDKVSFNIMQVGTEIENLKRSHALDGVYVFDDGVTKAMLRREIDGKQMHIVELFVDPFFQYEGIGTKMLESIVGEATRRRCQEVDLWVVENNDSARRFYEKNNFIWTGERERITEVKTGEFYRIRYSLKL